MKQYLDLLNHILEHGEFREDRTGTGTLSVFGYQSRYNLAEGFPLVTTKKLHTKSIFHELLWFMSGSTNIRYLKDNGVSIWDEWATANGDLGPVYGHQWRHWGASVDDVKRSPDGKAGVDQIQQLIDGIKNNPQSRRHIVSAWNVADIPQMKLPPCHALFQFYVHSDRRLSCQLYQRSADVFLGVPFNIASYALFLHMIAAQTDLKPGEFVHTLGDAHLYKNHIEQAKLQLTRAPMKLPTLELNPNVKSIFDYRFEDIKIHGYESHPSIKADISV